MGPSIIHTGRLIQSSPVHHHQRAKQWILSTTACSHLPRLSWTLRLPSPSFLEGPAKRKPPTPQCLNGPSCSISVSRDRRQLAFGWRSVGGRLAAVLELGWQVPMQGRSLAFWGIEVTLCLSHEKIKRLGVVARGGQNGVVGRVGRLVRDSCVG